jgi:hypothetical protein
LLNTTDGLLRTGYDCRPSEAKYLSYLKHDMLDTAGGASAGSTFVYVCWVEKKLGIGQLRILNFNYYHSLGTVYAEVLGVGVVAVCSASAAFCSAPMSLVQSSSSSLSQVTKATRCWCLDPVGGRVTLQCGMNVELDAKNS